MCPSSLGVDDICCEEKDGRNLRRAARYLRLALGPLARARILKGLSLHYGWFASLVNSFSSSYRFVIMGSCWLFASGVSPGRQDSGRSCRRQRVSRLSPWRWHLCGVLLLLVAMACGVLQENAATSTWQADAFIPVAPFGVTIASGRQIASKHTGCRPPCSPPFAFSPSRSLAETRLFSSTGDQSNENNEKDDGWDDDSSNDESARTTTSPHISPTQLSSNSQQQEEPERDMFIPIFALVSVTGLFGAYAYETLRLASKGELYLPWNQ